VTSSTTLRMTALTWRGSTHFSQSRASMLVRIIRDRERPLYCTKPSRSFWAVTPITLVRSDTCTKQNRTVFMRLPERVKRNQLIMMNLFRRVSSTNQMRIARWHQKTDTISSYRKLSFTYLQYINQKFQRLLYIGIELK